MCFVRNPALCFPSYFRIKTSMQGLFCLKSYSLFPFRFSSLHKFNPQPWNSFLIFLVMMRVNSWTILQTLLTVLSSYFSPSFFFQTVPGSLCLATVWHVKLTLFQLPAVLSFHAMDCSLHYSQTRVFYFQRANLFPQQLIKWRNLIPELFFKTFKWVYKHTCICPS